MSARREGDAILLEGDCPAEDAEILLQLLQQSGVANVDVGGMGRPHTAVVQVLLAAGPRISGVPRDVFIRDRILPLIRVKPEATGPTGARADPL